MTEYKPDEYIPTIDAILSVADLNTVSVKKIRGALQELFSIDLTEHKSDINDVILKRYHRLASEQEEKSEQQKREEMIKKDALLALQLSRESVGRRNKAPPVAERKAKKIKKEARGGAFSKPVRISNELYNVIGVEKDSRGQIVKRLWEYIKNNQLQDPSNKRQILCDEKLEKVFKKKKVDSFGMQKDLTHHIFKDDDVSPESQTIVPKPAPPPPPPPAPREDPWALTPDPVSSESEEE